MTNSILKSTSMLGVDEAAGVGFRQPKERPILFQGAMVRAILAGTKTQTRRAMARQKKYDFTDYTLFGQRGHPDDQAERRGGWARPWVAIEHAPDWPDGNEDQCPCPYASQRGDRLWVRENGWERPERTPKMMREGADTWAPYYYDADGISEQEAADFKAWGFKRRPSIHMPRKACRIELEVTDWRGGWDACRNRCRDLVDEAIRAHRVQACAFCGAAEPIPHKLDCARPHGVPGTSNDQGEKA